MGKILIVGTKRLEWLKDPLLRHLPGADVAKWMALDQTSTVIDMLNEASLMVFLNHAASLEGHTEQEAFDAFISGASRFKNLPWWEDSFWVPAELERSSTLDGGTTFIGSSPALLRELADLQALSPLDLGEPPRGYAEMPAGGASESFEETLSEQDCVKWIWRALHDGAHLAIEEYTMLAC